MRKYYLPQILLVVICIIMLCGCAGKSKQRVIDDPAQELELVWVLPGDRPKDLDRVLLEANKYLKKKLNIKLKLLFTDIADYDKKIPAMLMAGDQVDILWTSNWAADYRDLVARNMIIQLDDLLGEYGESLVDVIEPVAMNGCRVNGKTYIVPSNSAFARQQAFTFNKRLVDKYNYDFTHISSSNELIALFEKLKQDNPVTMFPILSADWLNARNKFDYIVSTGIPGAILMSDRDCKVFNQYEQPDFVQLLQSNRKLYTDKMVFPLNRKDGDDQFKAGNIACRVIEYEPGIDEQMTRMLGWQVFSVPAYKPPIICSNSVSQTANAIPVNSRHAIRAVKLMNLINSDPYLFNLLTWGIEGVHYTRLQENVIRRTNAQEQLYAVSGWKLGNCYQACVPDGEPADKWVNIQAFNHAALQSPLLGFTLDVQPISIELAAVRNVCEEYRGIRTGERDLADLQPFIVKLKAAGLEKILQEMQRQIELWKKLRNNFTK